MALTSPRITCSRAGRLVAGALWIGFFAMPIAAFSGADMLSVIVGALTLFVGAITASFSRRYMRSDPVEARFFGNLGLLVLAVLVLVFAGNVLLIALGWCLSGWALARLVGHSSGLEDASAACRRTMRSFILGDGALLAALGLLAWHAGSIDLAVVPDRAGSLSPFLLTLAALGLLIAAAARCALPPFSGWLMSSMTAPTPVSALMHAGLVNAGGFLLLRFAPVFEMADIARFAAVGTGLFAAFWGLGIMMVRPDIKGSIAGSTVAQMGFMIMSCGLGAYAAALWHLVAHGLFKAWLFLGSGSAIGIAGNRRSVLVDPKLATATAAILFAGVGAAIFSGLASAGVVPLTLGLLTGLTTLAAVLGGDLRGRTRIGLGAIIAGLFAVNGLGLLFAAGAFSSPPPALLGSWEVLALLAVFLASWAAQHGRLAARRPLPPALYAALINAGALR